MTSRQINMFLWTGSVVFCALAVAAVGWTFLNPVQPQAIAASSHAVPTTNPTAMVNLPSLSDVQPFLDKPLRHNFSGSASATVAAAQQNSTDPPLTLVGTIGNSLAMLKTRDGKIELKAVGESISGLTILTITPAKVEARYNGRTISLDKQRRG
jgi:hypothetical protein